MICVMVREITWLQGSSHGWGCGYIGVDRSHPWYGKEYDELGLVEVHGGLTYSGHAKSGL